MLFFITKKQGKNKTYFNYKCRCVLIHDDWTPVLSMTELGYELGEKSEDKYPADILAPLAKVFMFALGKENSVADPGRYSTDPDPADEKKPDPDPSEI